MFGPLQAETRVKHLLKKHDIASAPVQVEKIAEGLGLEVHVEPHEDQELSGALDRSQEGVRILWVNANHSTTRQRFTMAHEIGHFLLHDDLVHIDRKFPSEALKGQAAKTSHPFLRDALSSQATDKREIEANRFAATLLMPSELLAQHLKGHRLPLGNEDVTKLATTFEVSSQAMTYRLINLGIPVETA